MEMISFHDNMLSSPLLPVLEMAEHPRMCGPMASYVI